MVSSCRYIYSKSGITQVGHSRLALLLVVLSACCFCTPALAQDGPSEAEANSGSKLEYKLMYLNAFLGFRNFETDGGATIEHVDFGAEFGYRPLSGLGYAVSMRYYEIELMETDIIGDGFAVEGDLYYTFRLTQNQGGINWFLRGGALLDFGFATVEDKPGTFDGDIDESSLRPYAVAGTWIDAGEVEIMIEGGVYYDLTLNREGSFSLGGGLLSVNGDIEPENEISLLFNSLFLFGSKRQHGAYFGVRLLNETMFRVGYTFRF